MPREVVAPRTAALMIRHQMDDACHSWALNEGRYSPSQTVKLAPGGRVTFTNNDTGVHRMVQVGGPMAASVRGPQMIEQGAASALRVRFPKAGTYRFESEHPNPHMGENVLRLRVVVS